MVKLTSGGVIDTGTREVAVNPTGPSSPTAAITHVELATRRKTDWRSIGRAEFGSTAELQELHIFLETCQEMVHKIDPYYTRIGAIAP